MARSPKKKSPMKLRGGQSRASSLAWIAEEREGELGQGPAKARRGSGLKFPPVNHSEVTPKLGKGRARVVNARYLQSHAAQSFGSGQPSKYSSSRQTQKSPPPSLQKRSSSNSSAGSMTNSAQLKKKFSEISSKKRSPYIQHIKKKSLSYGDKPSKYIHSVSNSFHIDDFSQSSILKFPPI